MAAGIVERTILIQAPHLRVWEAITQPDQLIQWFVPGFPGTQMERDENGVIKVYVGEMGIDIAVLEMAEPMQKASLTGLPDGLVTATFALKDANDGMEVTVTLAGVEALPEDERDSRIAAAGDAWNKTLENLKAYVEGSELPFPQAFVGPLFGHWREVKQRPAIERSIWIRAPRERVWTAITDPKQLQQWFSPNTPWELSSLEVGGRYYVVDPETNGEMYVQIIEHMDPPHQFITHSAPGAGTSGAERTIYTLQEENGGTRLALIHTGYEEQPDTSRWGSMEQNGFGFGIMLQNIKAFIAGEPLPWPQGF